MLPSSLFSGAVSLSDRSDPDVTSVNLEDNAAISDLSVLGSSKCSIKSVMFVIDKFEVFPVFFFACVR